MTESRTENSVVDCQTTLSRCFYCRKTWDFNAHGMAVSCMNVHTFQDLVDMGWTRSGFYVYKPIMNKMCCPAYTHRLNVEAFEISRSQKKALKKWRRYLQGGGMTASEERIERSRGEQRRHRLPYEEAFRVLLHEVIDRWSLINDYDQVEADVDIRRPSPRLSKLLGPSIFLTSPTCIPLFHSSHVRCRQRWTSADDIAKDMCQIFAEYKDQFSKEGVEHVLDDVTLQHQNGHLNFVIEDKNRLKDVRRPSSVIPPSRSEDTSFLEAMDMIRTPSLSSSEAPSVRSLPMDFSIPLPRPRKFDVIWKPAVFDEEEYRLYKKYQMAVHGDCPRYIDRRRYRRFLVDTPLKHIPPTDGLSEYGSGSFHIQYRIDDRLVGVSVVDLLPRCLSSNYFFWDPDFASLQLGKISALMEIEWIRTTKKKCPGLAYYYLGHYIHSCPKTSYKRSYAPSELLCPEKHVWVTISDEVKSCLDAQPYVVLSALPAVQCRPNHVIPSEKPSSMDAQTIQLPGGERLSFGSYVKKLEEEGELDQSRHHVLDQLKTRIKEWRTQTMPVCDRLIYCCR